MKEIIEVTDLFRAATLLCHGAEVVDVKLAGHTVSFEITGENIYEVANWYSEGKALVEPLQFKDNLNALKDLMFNKLRAQEELRARAA